MGLIHGMPNCIIILIMSYSFMNYNYMRVTIYNTHTVLVCIICGLIMHNVVGVPHHIVSSYDYT